MSKVIYPKYYKNYAYGLEHKMWEIFALVGALWQYGLWNFQTGGTKSERLLPKNQHTQRKLLNF